VPSTNFSTRRSNSPFIGMSKEIPIDVEGCLKGLAERDERHCKCGCAEEDAANVAGWCMWCDHVYRFSAFEPKKIWSYHYTDEDDGRGEDLHFAKYCPGAPNELKRSAIRRLSEDSLGR